MADLEWSAVVSDFWITISANGQSTSDPAQPLVGTGNTNIDISVEPSLPGTEQQYGTVTITSDNLVKVINVDRCGNNCGCDKVSPLKDEITFNWDSEGEMSKQIFLSLPDCAEEQNIHISNTGDFGYDFSPISSEYTVYPISKNESDFEKYGVLTIQYGECKPIEVNLIQNTNSCTCDKIVTYDANWDSDESGSKTIVEIIDASCYSFGDGTIIEESDAPHKYKIGDITLQFNYPSGAEYEGWFDKYDNTIKIKTSPDKSQIWTRPSGDNVFDNGCECNVNVIFNKAGTSVPCTGEKYSLELTQDGVGPCSCGGIKPAKGTIEWDSDVYGANHIRFIASGVNSRCVKNLSYKFEDDNPSNSHFGPLQPNNGSIYTCPIAPNTETEDITTKIIINYINPSTEKSCDTIEVPIKHKAKLVLYIHASYVTNYEVNNKIIPYAGGTATIKYYISNSEKDDETKAITEQSILDGLVFNCASDPQITCGDPTVNNGIFNVTATFGTGGDKGKECEFTISHQAANPQTKKVTIYQASEYENIIPNCDYFVFNYSWGASDGKDLDSLTQIRAMRKVSDNVYAQKNFPVSISSGWQKELSGLTVGYNGTSITYESFNGNTLKYVKTQDDKMLMKFGGDNLCNSSEYTIVCIKNILEYGTKNEYLSQNDEIWIDIYANWWSQKNSTHQMEVSYEQYTGLTELGKYEDEIEEIPQSDCTELEYKKFGPKSGKCEKIGDTKKTRKITVNAFGTSNSIYATSTDCLIESDDYPKTPYTHVARLVYDIKNDNTKLLDNFKDKGLDNSTNIKSVSINGVEHTFNIDSIYNYPQIPSEGAHVIIDDVYIRHQVDTQNTKDIYIYDNMADYLTLDEYKGNTDPSNKNKNVYAANLKNGESDIYNFSFVKNFKVIKKSNSKLKIQFDFIASTESKEFDIGIYAKMDYIFPCSYTYFYGYIQFKQNNII